MIRVVHKLLELLSKRERKEFFLLLLLVVGMALLDMIGVASIMPFIAVLASPAVLETNPLLAEAQRLVGLPDPHDFLWFLGVAVFLLLIFSAAFRAWTTYFQLRFTLSAEYKLGERLVEGYLRQPYTWFLNRHSADLGKTVLSEVTNVIHGGLIPLITLIAQSTLALAIFVLLFVADPLLSLSSGLVLGLSYGLLYSVMKRLLSRIGAERVTANQKRFTAINEAFSGIKVVKSSGLEAFYTARFAHPAELYARHSATSNIAAQLPRFFVEALAFGGMMLIILLLMARDGRFVDALPVITLYAFAAYRLMPALQQIYAALAQLRFVGPALDLLHEDLHSLDAMESPPGADGSKALGLQDRIVLKDIHFAYPGAAASAVRGLDLSIAARSTVGVVGPTGSGKTTLIDIILGLLSPQDGTMEVDGQVITTENRRAWQRAIGYVPQQIHLSDDTLAANIAYGVPDRQIDMDAVVRAAKIAHLHDFVDTNLPAKYDTVIGEQGVRLSGGQRQRIGIARALYRNPSVLILDEATSALDNLTEQAVMEAVNELRHDITVILIAHRLTTVRTCDTIFLLENGEVAGQGTYVQLVRDNERFRTMAET